LARLPLFLKNSKRLYVLFDQEYTTRLWCVWELAIYMRLRENPKVEFIVEEKFPKENFRVNREMRDEILVYESILAKFWAKMVSKCMENSVKICILGFRC